MPTITLVDGAHFDVPDRVLFAWFEVAAGRGQRYTRTDQQTPMGSGGLAGVVRGKLAVAAGLRFEAVVGQSGADGGLPDGGPGGSFTESGVTAYGGRGGGRSTLVYDGTTVAIAGAGGGGAGPSVFGGAGGIPDGSAGDNSVSPPADGGPGGTSTAAGTDKTGTGVFGGKGGGYFTGGRGQGVGKLVGGAGGAGSSMVDASVLEPVFDLTETGSHIWLTYVAAPLTPTILGPLDGQRVPTGPVTLAWRHEGEQAQSKADIEYRPLGGATTPIAIADGTQTATTAALAAGDYEWRVTTYDLLGQVSPASRWVPIRVEAVPAAPVIISPTDGATITDPTFPVTWTASGQQAHQVQVLVGSTVIFDFGLTVGTGTTVDVPATVAGSVTVRARVRGAHLWSGWDSVAVTLDVLRPAAPIVTLYPDPKTASIGVGWQQPIGPVEVDHYDVTAIEPDGTVSVGRTLDPATRDAVFGVPRAGVPVTIRVDAVGVNGVTSSGEAQ